MSCDINSSKLVKHNVNTVGNSLQVWSLVINRNMSLKKYFRGNLQKIVKRWALLKFVLEIAVKKAWSEIPGCLNFTETKVVFCYQKLRKTFEIRGWRQRIFKFFEITWTICWNIDRSEHFLVTECFFNLFLDVW